MALSIFSLAVALVALAVNVSSLLRRPRIVAEWGDVQDEPQPFEGLSIIVTARRRPIEVDEVGVVFFSRSTLRWQVPEWLHMHKPQRVSLRIDGELPRTLTDGQSVRAFAELDSLIDRMYEQGIADKRGYTYVKASGTVYLPRARQQAHAAFETPVGRVLEGGRDPHGVVCYRSHAGSCCRSTRCRAKR